MLTNILLFIVILELGAIAGLLAHLCYGENTVHVNQESQR